MVTCRRLKRPPRRSAHLARHRARVSLADAGVERLTSRVDEEVSHMQDERGRAEDSENERMWVQEEGSDGESDEEEEAATEGSMHGAARSMSTMSLT